MNAPELTRRDLCLKKVIRTPYQILCESLAVPVAIVTSFIVTAVSPVYTTNKGHQILLLQLTASTTSESTADLVKSTEISSSMDNKANKEKVEECFRQKQQRSGKAAESSARLLLQDYHNEYCHTPILGQPRRRAVGSVRSSNGNTAGAVILMQRHRWQLRCSVNFGSQLLRVSQMVTILQQMVQVYQVFFRQCLDG